MVTININLFTCKYFTLRKIIFENTVEVLQRMHNDKYTKSSKNALFAFCTINPNLFLKT